MHQVQLLRQQVLLQQVHIIPYPGFGAYFYDQSTGTYVPNNTPSIVGAIFQGNTCSNATNCPIMFNSGTSVYGTTFYNNTAPSTYSTDANFTVGGIGSTGSYKH